MISTRCAVALTLCFTFAACAGQPKKATPPNKEKIESVDPKVVTKKAGAFDTLPMNERGKFMKTVIVPKMTAVFQAFDSAHFAKVGCVTCHGPGAKEGKFEMPSPALPKLDFSNKDPKVQRWNAFMKTKVVPTMAAALGEEPYDPATKKGFGCLDCHMKAAKK